MLLSYTQSVGENNGISTIYNVGKIKADNTPNGNMVSAIGSKADMSSADNNVTQKTPVVNINSKSHREPSPVFSCVFGCAKLRITETVITE